MDDLLAKMEKRKKQRAAPSAKKPQASSGANQKGAKQQILVSVEVVQSPPDRGARARRSGAISRSASPAKQSPSRHKRSRKQALLGSRSSDAKAARRLDLPDEDIHDEVFGPNTDDDKTDIETEPDEPAEEEQWDEKVLADLREESAQIKTVTVTEPDYVQKVDSVLELSEQDKKDLTQKVVIPSRDDDPERYRIDGSNVRLEVPIYKKGQDGGMQYLVTLTTVPDGMTADDFLKIFIRACRKKRTRVLHAACRAELGKKHEKLHFHLPYLAHDGHRWVQLRGVVIKFLNEWQKKVNPAVKKDFSPNWKELRFEIGCAYSKRG